MHYRCQIIFQLFCIKFFLEKFWKKQKKSRISWNFINIEVKPQLGVGNPLTIWRTKNRICVNAEKFGTNWFFCIFSTNFEVACVSFLFLFQCDCLEVFFNVSCGANFFFSGKLLRSSCFLKYFDHSRLSPGERKNATWCSLNDTLINLKAWGGDYKIVE